MPGLKAWDGSSFVDGEPRIWNGSAFVAPSSCHAWDGSQFVKVWPTFTRQRMVKVGTFGRPGNINATEKITGWSSDTTYPASITSDSLVVQGSGTVTLAWSFSGSGGTTTVRHNGTQVGSGRSGSTQIAVTSGDEITGWLTSTYGVNTSVTAGSWIEVAPA